MATWGACLERQRRMGHGAPVLSVSEGWGMARGVSPPARAVALLIRGYQRFISPVLPPSCRFAPSCSQYALEAVTRHGAIRGSWLAVRRIARCHPWNPGGYDPVP